jgi:hypothetical protein
MLDQADAHVLVDIGSAGQLLLTPAAMGLATSVPASGSVLSTVIPTNGNKSFAFATTSSQAGTISIQRYLDFAGTIPQGAPLTAALTAATAAVVNATDGVPFQAMQVTVTNSGTAAATLTNTGLLIQSH